MQVEIVSDEERLRALVPEWQTLHAADPYARVALSPDYALLGWETVATVKAGARLRVVIGRAGEEFVALWPLWQDGRGRVRHFGCSSNEEYAGALLNSKLGDRELDALVAAALPPSGVLEAYNLYEDDPLLVALRRVRTRVEQQFAAPLMRTGQYRDPQAFRAELSRNLRQSVKNDRRHLAKLGAVRTGLAAPGAESDRLVDWLFDAKLPWLRANGVRGGWMEARAPREFFKRLLRAGQDQAALFALHCGARVAAAAILLRGRDLEYLTVANDLELGRFSPGHLLLDALAELGIADGQDIDLKITRDAYKLRWAGGERRGATCFVGQGPRGTATILTMHGREAVRRARLRVAALRRRLKGASSRGRTRS